MPLSNRPIWRPYTQEKTAFPPIEISKAEGAYLYTKSGQKIFDGISSWWLITHGHCHPAVVEAVQRQVAKLDQVVFSNFSHQPAEELAALLVEITPKDLTRVFFTDNGSTAVESALKMAIQACAQGGQRQKQKFLAFESAYHGDTVGAMSISGDSAFNRPYRKTLFEVLRAKHPKTSKGSSDEFVQDFQRLIEEHHQNLAGVIIEPLIQGAGGMIVWPKEALQRIAQLCKRYGVILIFDEVMTGFGRTGKLFAMNKLEVVPDILCLSKGLTGGTLPLAVTMVREEIYRAFLSDDRSRMLFHGHSFTGNPISCAAAIANIKLFLNRNAIDILENIEKIHIECSEEFRRRSDVIDVRICGTMAALEFETKANGYLSDFSMRLSSKLVDRGVFLRPLGNIAYFLPPYCSSTQDLKAAWDILQMTIQEELS